MSGRRVKVEWENGTKEGRKAELELIAMDRGRGPDDRDPESDHDQSYFHQYLTV